MLHITYCDLLSLFTTTLCICKAFVRLPVQGHRTLSDEITILSVTNLYISVAQEN